MLDCVPKSRFLAISAVVIAFGVSLAISEPSLYRPYFGNVHPIVAIAAVCLAGWLALHFLGRVGVFLVSKPSTRARDLLMAVALAMPFMVLVTIADVLLHFPRDINVALPEALLFYPTMGYVAQLALHAVPLAILIPLLGSPSPSWSSRIRTWLCFAIVAIPEATFQATSTSTDNALTMFTAVHLFLFGLTELYIFWRYDFIAMFVFRMTYYACWHIGWGYFRLEWLLL